MLKAHFQQFAAYNAGANGRLYDQAGSLSDQAYRRPVGVFFQSLHGTLNHLLVTDRIWLARLTGAGSLPGRLNAILFENFNELRATRAAEDARLAGHIESLSDDDFEATFEYRQLSGARHKQIRREALAHLFNHQTHHRSQAHTCLSLIGADPLPLDLLYYQRNL